MKTVYINFTAFTLIVAMLLCAAGKKDRVPQAQKSVCRLADAQVRK